MPKPFHQGGKQSIGGVGTRASGYRKPSYTGADQSRGSSKGTKSKQAAPFNKGAAGGAKAGNGPKNRKPGQGPMGQGAAHGHQSFPTRGTGQRQKAGSPGATLKNTSYR